LRDTEPELVLGREARRIQTADPAAWADGLELRQRALGAGARQAEGPGRG
jgi:hypothetical protein